MYSLGIIPILLLLVFNYIPMFGVIIAFKDYKYNKGIFGSEWVGFDNFKLFVQSNDFTNIAWNTIYLNAIFIIAGMIAADEIPAETARMAMAIVVAGPALVIFPFFQKYFVKGLTVGSVKG